MARRAAVRSSDITTTLSALKEAGIVPVAMDTLQNGGVRWHFTPPDQSDEDELDRELREHEERHGRGRA